MPIVKVNGVSIHYHVHGEGIPIVFIHPPLLTSVNFKYQKEQLSDEFQVITFDIRGHGHSEPSSQKLTYPLIVEDMKQLLDVIGVKQAYVCGYSTGGSIALEAMLTYPHLFLGGILISGMSEVSDWILKQRLRMASFLSKLKAKRLLTWAISYGNADRKQTYRNLYKDALQGDIRNIGQYYRYSLSYSCTDKLNQLKLPVLMIFGEKDKSFRRYAKIMKLQLPNVQMHMVPGKHHQIPTKAANVMNEHIRTWIHQLQHDRVNVHEVDEEKPNFLPPAYTIASEETLQDQL